MNDLTRVMAALTGKAVTAIPADVDWALSVARRCCERLDALYRHREPEARVMLPSGRLVDPFAMSPEDVTLEDIAHLLAQTPRWGGACLWPYSVAEHSVSVAERVFVLTCSYGAAAFALLHDAAEAYLGDVRQPLKGRPALREIREAEAQVLLQIYMHFHLESAPNAHTRALIRDADAQETKREAAWLMPQSPVWEEQFGDMSDPGPIIEQRDFTAAKRLFLDAARAYGL